MLDQAWEALKGLDWGSDMSPLAAIDQAIDQAQGNPAAQAELEEKMLGMLGATTHAGRDYIVRRLVLIGSERSVAALSPHLTQAETSHQARLTLEQLHLPAAVEALRAAVPAATGAAKIGLMGSLAKLGDAQATPLFATAAGSDDAEVRAAAIWCLGQIGDETAAAALANVPAEEQTTVMRTDALLSCAERLLAAGNPSAARAIFSKFTGESQPQHVRLAANKGLLATVRR